MALTPTKNTALMKPNGNYDQMRIFEKNNKIESQRWSVLSGIAIFSDVCLTVWGATYTGHSIGRHWIVKEFKNNTTGSNLSSVQILVLAHLGSNTNLAIKASHRGSSICLAHTPSI